MSTEPAGPGGRETAGRIETPGPGPLAELTRLMSSYSRGPEGQPVRSVAVVGNAPMEPSAARADAVDACDLVLRVNSFVTDRGRPRAQGLHTDVVLLGRLTRATPDFFEGYRRRLYVLLEPMRMYGRREMWPPSWPADLGLVVARNDEVAIPLNDALTPDWRERHLAPTTGLTAAWLAVTCFPDADVLLTGLSFVEDATATTWRHQDGAEWAVGPEHEISLESRLVRQWRDDDRVRVLPMEAA